MAARFGDGAGSQQIINDVRASREAAAWRVDYDISLTDRVGRSERWVGRCRSPAPAPVAEAGPRR